MYSIGGGAGSRLVIRTRCRSPIEPSTHRVAHRLWAGSKRRLKPIWNGTPASSTAASAPSTVAEVERDRLLAEDRLAGARRRRRSARRGCRCSCRSRRRRRRAEHSSSGRRDGHAELGADRIGAASCASYTPATAAPATRRASSSACMRPIRPTPSTPTRSGAEGGHDITRPPSSPEAPAQGAVLDGGPQSRAQHRKPGRETAAPAVMAVAERGVLDRDQVLEPDRVALAGDERAVVAEALAAEHGGVTRPAGHRPR